MLDMIKAIIYGIVEGITEWLPISSTGHLILVEQFLPFKNVSEGFFEMFDVVIQLGAILAVVVLFFWKLWPFYIKGAKKKRIQFEENEKDIAVGKLALSMNAFFMWLKIVVACIPAVIYGVLLDDVVEELFGKTIGTSTVTIKAFVVVAMLLIVGILFILVENKNKDKETKVKDINSITYKQAFIIGLFQLVAAALPGTSRSGSTILGGIAIGIDRVIASEFTFFLGIPVMFGASLLKVLKFGFVFTTTELALLGVASLVSFVVSLAVIKFLMSYIKKHDFKVFGYYRIILALIVFAYFMFRIFA